MPALLLSARRLEQRGRRDPLRPDDARQAQREHLNRLLQRFGGRFVLLALAG
jgi:hypothetical protein